MGSGSLGNRRMNDAVTNIIARMDALAGHLLNAAIFMT